MVAKKETVVRIVVEGPESSKNQALGALVRDASQAELRNAFDGQSASQLVRIAQAVHGRLYRKLHY